MRFIALFLTAAALIFAGCSHNQPIYNVEKTPIVGPAGKTLTMTQVQQAIIRAGAQLGWQMQPEGPGRIGGRLSLRQHLAVIGIEYDAKAYSIKYRDSSGLNASDGSIHKNYNSWIQNLEKAIAVQTTSM